MCIYIYTLCMYVYIYTLCMYIYISAISRGLDWLCWIIWEELWRYLLHHPVWRSNHFQQSSPICLYQLYVCIYIYVYIYVYIYMCIYIYMFGIQIMTQDEDTVNVAIHCPCRPTLPFFTWRLERTKAASVTYESAIWLGFGPMFQPVAGFSNQSVDNLWTYSILYVCTHDWTDLVVIVT